MIHYVTSLVLASAAMLAAISGGPAVAQSPAFTYQGQLLQNGNPVGSPSPVTCTLQFTLFAAAAGGSALGSQSKMVSVDKGVFTTTLDFGAASFDGTNGTDRYLEISGTCPGSSFNLPGRQPITATPYALYARKAGDLECTGCVGASDLASGLPPSGTAGGDLTGTYPNPIIKNDAVTAAKVQFNYAASNAEAGPATSLQCAAPCVENAEIATNAVGTTQLQDNAVTSAKIANGTITPADLSAAGSSNAQVLTSNGSSVSWQNQSGGGLSSVARDNTLINNGTVGSPLGVAIPLLLGGSGPSIFLRGTTTTNLDGMRLHYNETLRYGVIDVRGLRLLLRGSTSGAGDLERLGIDLATGNVGIGVASPNLKLELPPGSHFGSDDGATTLHLFGSTIEDTGSSILRIWAAGGNGNIVLGNAGKVGINDSAPTDTLTVNGSVRIKPLGVPGQVCDVWVDGNGKLYPTFCETPPFFAPSRQRPEKGPDDLAQENARLRAELREVRADLRRLQERLEARVQILESRAARRSPIGR